MIEAEKASADRAQSDITRLEEELIAAKIDIQKAWEAAVYRAERIKQLIHENEAGDAAIVTVADQQECIEDLKRDLYDRDYEIRGLRNDRTFYKELAIERHDHPFSNLWIWFKRLF